MSTFMASSNRDATTNATDETNHTEMNESSNCNNSSSQEKVKAMIDACRLGQMHTIQSLLQEDIMYGSQQDDETGQSPLMAAAHVGNAALCQFLLQDAAAPWNALDRNGHCAGDYATHAEHWSVVQLLVDWAVRSELVLGRIERNLRLGHQQQQQKNQKQSESFPETVHHDHEMVSDPSNGLIQHEPSTKPDYLQQQLYYTPDGRALLDSDRDAVMMAWERPIMNVHAQMLMIGSDDNDSNKNRACMKSVLNVGFGMGIIDTALQEYQPTLHIIIEAHPNVYEYMQQQGWNHKPNVRICFGTWQEIIPQLIAEGVQVDAIFYDTYGEHYTDMEDFHTLMVAMLRKPHGVYSFFNGLAPDNLFFHGVACQCVKLQLTQLGLDSEFVPCHIESAAASPSPTDANIWHGIRRPYWYGRNVYYLPHCTWNTDFLTTGQVTAVDRDDIGSSCSYKQRCTDASNGETESIICLPNERDEVTFCLESQNDDDNNDNNAVMDVDAVGLIAKRQRI